MSDTDQLEQMLAREQIRDLVNRYAVAIDGQNVDDLAELFDPEIDSEKYGHGQKGGPGLVHRASGRYAEPVGSSPQCRDPPG